jgi:FkbM family methyltransferase
VIRELLERFSRGIVLTRQLPRELGGLSMLVSPDASLRYWKRDLWEIDEVLLKSALKLVRSADTVWDVGANVGLFAFASAGLAGTQGQVLAIEPDPWLSNLLRRSVHLNRNAIDSIAVLPCAVADKAGSVVLNVASRGRATSYLLGSEPSTQTGGIRNSLTVEAVTLDGLLEHWAPPKVVKIDVEGAEALVLKGGAQMLRSVRPKIICEVSDANRQQTTEILVGAGYTLYDAEHDWPNCRPIDDCAWNTIALPGEAS